MNGIMNYVWAKYTLEQDNNSVYVTEKTRFRVMGDIKRDDRYGIRVLMNNYDLKGKAPSPGLSEELEKGAKVTYYYNKTNQRTNGIKWGTAAPKAGTYYIYAVIGETVDYNKYTTPTRKFTVYADHKWNIPKKLTSKVQRKQVHCAYCGKTRNVTLPKKSVNVMMGKSVTLGSKGYTYALGKSARVSKKYFRLSKNGKVTTKTKPSCYKSMPSSVPVVVKACGKLIG